MRIEATKVIADSLCGTSAIAGVAAWMGWFNFINDNAPFFGVVISGTVCVSSIVFYILTWNKDNKSVENKVVIEYLKEELNKIKQGIENGK